MNHGRSIVEAIQGSIDHTHRPDVGADIRPELYANIVLAGGTTMIPGPCAMDEWFHASLCFVD